jgi:hypothetical protein
MMPTSMAFRKWTKKIDEVDVTRHPDDFRKITRLCIDKGDP